MITSRAAHMLAVDPSVRNRNGATLVTWADGGLAPVLARPRADLDRALA